MAASESKQKPIGREPIRADRVRGVDGQGFAFIPNRFLREGFFVSLTPDEQRLYVLLVLAADRRGLSFYHYDSICSLLEIPVDDYVDARDGLIEKDLVAYDGTRFQVLSLPASPVARRSRPVQPIDTEPDEHTGSEIRRAALAALRRSIA